MLRVSMKICYGSTFVVQLVGAPASDAFSGEFTPRLGHTHVKDFTVIMKSFFLRYVTSKLH